MLMCTYVQLKYTKLALCQLKLRAEAHILKLAVGNVDNPSSTLAPSPNVTHAVPAPTHAIENIRTANPAIENVRVHEGLVQVTKMPPDGHCLFSAILHQLGQSNPQLGATLIAAVAKLRLRVVDLIRQLEISPGDMWYDQIMDSAEAAAAARPERYHRGHEEIWPIIFVEGLLDDEWGGTETISAVSHLENVTINVFVEAADDGFAHQTFQPLNVPTAEIINIVYRLADNNGHRNHYDSLYGFLSM